MVNFAPLNISTVAEVLGCCHQLLIGLITEQNGMFLRGMDSDVGRWLMILVLSSRNDSFCRLV
uniref:Uncharacterized protein MANES_05G071600 n=1 Tax=Rhizophora mucronata TaxID=61149 RepID=A0A2P2QYI1_RHIMU